MPEYLAPGVYVEETSFRTKTIEGVSTSTAGFVGPTRTGPTSGYPELLTSLADFERIYGGLDPMVFDTEGPTPNFLAQAVRSFFNNGGSRLYVSRAYTAASPTADGIAHAEISNGSPPNSISLKARFPGSGGNVTLTFTLTLGPNILGASPAGPVPRGLSRYDIVWVSQVTSPPATGGTLQWAEDSIGSDNRQRWQLHAVSGPAQNVDTMVVGVDEIRIVSATVQVTYPDSLSRTETFTNLTFDPRHPRSFSSVFPSAPSNRQQQLTLPFVFSYSRNVDTAGIEIADIMAKNIAASGLPQASAGQFTVVLRDGADGKRPEPSAYEGMEDPNDARIKTGLIALEDVTDIAIVAAPGSTFGGESFRKTEALTIVGTLIRHAEKMRYRIAVCDSTDQQSISQVLAFRALIDSTYAALYYPWVRILDPVTNLEINLPPSGFVAGIYARNDVQNGVHKAPANEIVQDAIGFEVMLNKAQQDVLNPSGVDCFRLMEGRGFRLWGARTATSDSEWKYVNLRRYMNYLKHSVDNATQFVVFENNGPDLWGRVTQLVADFLFAEFKGARLFGTKKEEAFFVRCDLTTMTQNDLDNGRLICLVGVALLRPAEFVIFRIGQFTAIAQQ